MASILQDISDICAFVLETFTDDPAAWTAAFLFLGGLMFTVKTHPRKKLRIATGRYTSGAFMLSVSNIGGVPVQIRSYGYKTWDGEVVERKNSPVAMYEQLIPEGPDEELLFYEEGTGAPLSVKEDEIYYVFVRTAAHRNFKRFFIPRPFSWIRSWYCRIRAQMA